MINSKKLKVLSITAILNTMVLVGCSEKPVSSIYTSNRNTIKYYNSENNDIDITGNVSFDTLRDDIKLVTFVSGDVEFTELVYTYEYFSRYGRKNHVELYDLSSGTLLIKLEKEHLEIGDGPDDMQVVDVQPFLPYIVLDDNFKSEYEAQELVDIYDEEVIKIKEKTK